MKVLILSSTFPNNPQSWNGIFVKEQANALLSEHNVCVVKHGVDYSKFSLFFKRALSEDSEFGYPVYRITVNKSLPVYNQFNYIISVFFELRKIIRKQKPDIIHCHYSYPSGVIALLIKWYFRIPYVVTEHTRIRTTFRSKLHRILSVIAMKKSYRVIAVSNSLKKEIEIEGINNVVVIPNVVNVEKFVRAKPVNPFTIGFLGSLNTHNKGLDILLNACAKLPFSFRIKIGGEGTYFEHYRNLSKNLGIIDLCTFCGNVDQSSIVGFYNDLSVFVLASRYETFGIVLVEAMSSGVPVIATRCGGPLDIVNDNNGILVDIDNPSQMRDALTRIEKEAMNYQPDAIINEARSKYSAKPFTDRISSLYRDCLLNI